MLNDLEFAAVVVGVGAAARLGWGLIRKVAGKSDEPIELTDDDFVVENYTRDPDQPEVGTFLQELEAFEKKAVKTDQKFFKDIRASGEPIKGKSAKGNLDSFFGNVVNPITNFNDGVKLWGNENLQRFRDAAPRPYNAKGNEGGGDAWPSLVNHYVPVAKEVKDPFEGFVEIKNDNPDFEKVYDDRKGRRIFVVNVAKMPAGEAEKLLERLKVRFAAAKAEKAEKDAFVPPESKAEAWLDQYDSSAVPEGEPNKFRQIDPSNPTIFGIGNIRLLPPSHAGRQPFRSVKTHCGVDPSDGEVICTNTPEHPQSCPLCEVNKKLTQHNEGTAFGVHEIYFYPIYFPQTKEYSLLKANSALHRKLVDLGASAEQEISHPYYGSDIRITRHQFGFEVTKLPSKPIAETPAEAASIVKKGCDLAKNFTCDEHVKLTQARFLDAWKKANTELAALIEPPENPVDPIFGKADECVFYDSLGKTEVSQEKPCSEVGMDGSPLRKMVGKKNKEMGEKLKNYWSGNKPVVNEIFLDVEGAKKPKEEPEKVFALGDWVEVTDKSKFYNGLVSVYGILGSLKEAKDSSKLVNGDCGKVVGFGRKNDNAHKNFSDNQRLLLVEVDGKKRMWIGQNGVKDAQTPKWEVGEVAYWITKTRNEQSKKPSKILNRQWNGTEWIYGLHWFNQDKEIKFNVEEKKMVNKHLHSAHHRLREYHDALVTWRISKDKTNKWA